MKPKFKIRVCFGVSTGLVVGLFAGLLVSSGDPVVGAASAASQAQNRQMNPELKMDLLIDADGDKVVSRILKLERQVNSLTKTIFEYDETSANTNDLKILSRRLAQAEVRWRDNSEKLKRRLNANEKAIKTLCAQPSHSGKIRRPGVPETLMGSACDSYKPAR